jgi:hypothetical protein
MALTVPEAAFVGHVSVAMAWKLIGTARGRRSPLVANVWSRAPA